MGVFAPAAGFHRRYFVIQPHSMLSCAIELPTSFGLVRELRDVASMVSDRLLGRETD